MPYFITIETFVIEYYFLFLIVTGFIISWHIGKIGGDTHFLFANKFCFGKK